MGEPQPSRRLGILDQHPGRDRFGQQRGHRCPPIVVHRGRQQDHVDLVTHRARDTEQFLARRSEPGHPPHRHPAQLGRHGHVDRGRAQPTLRRQQPDQLPDEERVAAADPVRIHRPRPVHRPAGYRRHTRRDLLDGERREPDHVRAGQVAEVDARCLGRRRPHRTQEQNPRVGDLPAHMPQQRHGRLVRPLNILEQQHQANRLGRGDEGATGPVADPESDRRRCLGCPLAGGRVRVE